MAVHSNKNNQIKALNDAYNTMEFSIGTEIKYSGIYECNICGFHIAMNKHQPKLPPHDCTHSQYKYMAFALIKNK
ncbi:hypothetical protein ABN085_19990 [Morganella morganii]|uniref:hypothetical protein n=1 Tax=Morganella morganii TaxID=582 RepID=UPI0032DB52A6